jgi:Carboxylesterase family
MLLIYRTSARPSGSSVTLPVCRRGRKGPYGAAPESELQYLCALPATVPRPPLNSTQQQLSSTTQHYRTNFAKFGTLNGSGSPLWASFDPVAGNFQSFNSQHQVACSDSLCRWDHRGLRFEFRPHFLGNS